MLIKFNSSMTWRFAEITKGMTQEQIAERLDCSVGQVNMMLSGKRKFHTTWISRIAEAWDIPEWQLFTNGHEIYPPEDRAIVEAYLKAPKHKRQTVNDILGIEDNGNDGNGENPTSEIKKKSIHRLPNRNQSHKGKA